ncbi:Hypothetical predicted protein, partial [Pelobates cultripes]
MQQLEEEAKCSGGEEWLRSCLAFAPSLAVFDEIEEEELEAGFCQEAIENSISRMETGPSSMGLRPEIEEATSDQE